MKTIFFQRAAFVLSLAAVTSVSNGLSAQAETTEMGIRNDVTQPVADQPPANSATQSATEATPTTPDAAVPVNSTQQPASQSLNPQLTELSVQTGNAMQTEASVTKTEATVKNQPIPGTATTSATPLVAQQDSIDVNVTGTRPYFASNYIGVGVNLGLAGSAGIGDPAFTIISKFRLGQTWSFRPAVVVNNNATFLLPLTYDLPYVSFSFASGSIRFAPYVGAGLLVTTDSGTVGGLVTAGFDMPITQQFTFNTSFDLGFTGSDAGLGIIMGVAYNFGNL